MTAKDTGNYDKIHVHAGESVRTVSVHPLLVDLI